MEQLPTDLELMTNLAHGDMSSFGKLITRHQEVVLSLATRILGSHDRASDITQETFLRVHRARGSYSPTARFTTWLYRIVVNLCMDELKRNKKTVPLLKEMARNDQTSRLEKQELAQEVQKAIGQLPPRWQIVLILSRYHGLSHQQISDSTGWSVSAVESLLVRSYRTLRKSLSHLSKI